MLEADTMTEQTETKQNYQAADVPDWQQWQLRNIVTARRERPATDYIVDRMFTRGSLNIVYGAPGSLKSMLLADMCCAIVGGVDWLPGAYVGGQGIQVKQTPVLWYDYDNGTRRTDERFDALSKAEGRYLADDAPLHYVSTPINPFVASDLDSTLYFIDVALSVNAQMIVIDNLGLITGEVEENSAGMAMVMGYLRIVAERTDAAVIAIHHQRKGGSGGGRAGDALRGHSSIEASLDLSIKVIREPDTQTVNIKSTKTRGVDVPPISALFNYEHKAGTHDLDTAHFSGIGQVKGANPVRDELMAIVREFGSISKGRLVDMAKDRLADDTIGINNIRNWVGELIDVEELLDVDIRGKTHVISIKGKMA